MKTKATKAARAVRAKLEALAARPGTPEEGAAAQKKLARLLEKYDFSQADISKDDIFKGSFRPASTAELLHKFGPDQSDIAAHVKWSIENETKIACLFRAGELYAQADRRTAARLAKIAGTVAQSFAELWQHYATAGANPADRGNFIAGLYDGMMNDARTGQALPRRASCPKVARAKCRAVGLPAGLNLHPYSVALNLGRQIRFSVSLDNLTEQLQTTLTGALPAGTN
jgi:hypothetical protein